VHSCAEDVGLMALNSGLISGLKVQGSEFRGLSTPRDEIREMHEQKCQYSVLIFRYFIPKEKRGA